MNFGLSLHSLLCLLLLFPAWAWAQASKRDIIESLAQTLQEDLVFYRWQSKTSGETLLGEHTYTPKRYDYFMSMPKDYNTMRAGQGVYVSENPFSSSSFIGLNDSGSFIQVRVRKGTKFLDLTDPKIRSLLINKYNLTVFDVFDANPRINLRYNEKHQWWVLKHPDGVTFEKLKVATANPQKLIDAINLITDSKPRALYIKELREAFLKEIPSRPELLTLTGIEKVFSVNEINSFSGKNLYEFGSKEAIVAKINQIKSSWSMIGVFEKDAPLRARVFDGMLRHLTGAEAFQLIKTFPINSQLEYMDLLSEKAHPQKYLDYLNSTASEMNTPVDKIKLGVFPESKVTQGMTPDLQKELTRVIEASVLEDRDFVRYLSRPQKVQDIQFLLDKAIATKNFELIFMLNRAKEKANDLIHGFATASDLRRRDVQYAIDAQDLKKTFEFHVPQDAFNDYVKKVKSFNLDAEGIYHLGKHLPTAVYDDLINATIGRNESKAKVLSLLNGAIGDTRLEEKVLLTYFAMNPTLEEVTRLMAQNYSINPEVLYFSIKNYFKRTPMVCHANLDYALELLKLKHSI